MKLSGIFWFIILAGLMYYAYTFGWICFSICYVVWCIIGAIIHNKIEHLDIFTGEEINFDELGQMALEYPYIFTIIHLFILGFFIGIGALIYYISTHLGEILSTFNNKLDNIDLKPKAKPKKKSFGEYKNNI